MWLEVIVSDNIIIEVVWQCVSKYKKMLNLWTSNFASENQEMWKDMCNIMFKRTFSFSKEKMRTTERELKVNSVIYKEDSTAIKKFWSSKIGRISMVLGWYNDQGTNKILVWLIDVIVTLLILSQLEVILFFQGFD